MQQKHRQCRSCSEFGFHHRLYIHFSKFTQCKYLIAIHYILSWKLFRSTISHWITIIIIINTDNGILIDTIEWLRYINYPILSFTNNYWINHEKEIRLHDPAPKKSQLLQRYCQTKETLKWGACDICGKPNLVRARLISW